MSDLPLFAFFFALSQALKRCLIWSVGSREVDKVLFFFLPTIIRLFPPPTFTPLKLLFQPPPPDMHRNRFASCATFFKRIPQLSRFSLQNRCASCKMDTNIHLMVFYGVPGGFCAYFDYSCSASPTASC